MEVNVSAQEIDRIFFEEHSSLAFKMIDERDICKFKYQKGYSLIDKVCEYFKYSVKNQDCFVFYYRKLLFDMLTGEFYCRSSKIKQIVADLKIFKSQNDNNECFKHLISLIELLELYQKGYLYRNSVRDKISKMCSVKLSYDSDDETQYGDSDFPDYMSSLVYPSLNYKDLRDKKIITLDIRDNVARDDAISIEKTNFGYSLYIYITDVSSFLGVDSELFNCAKKRGESIYPYIDNEYILMLPRDLTRDFFSLNQNCERYVIAHRFDFSSSFDFIGHDIFRALINVSRNYSFDGIKKIKDKSDYDMINMLIKITDSLRSQFNLSYHTMKEKFNPMSRKAQSFDMTGSNIITMSSLFLNSYIAELFKEMNYPYIYRANGTNLGDKYIQDSTYSASPLGHIINNGNCYGYVSTPMRKFSSLLNQYFELSFLIDKRFDNKFIENWQSYLPSIVEYLNTRSFMNQEYRDYLEVMCAKQLTKRR